MSCLTPSLTAPNGSGGALPPARAALAGATLADQVEQISINPEFTSTEEMSRLWSALQARYRPSATYKLSAVLLEAYQDTAQARTDAHPYIPPRPRYRGTAI